MKKTSFKGWTIPGPEVPGGVNPSVDETCDALCGHFKIFQAKEGHRFSTDDLLTAWFGAQGCPTASRILDLGSGMGTVAMISAWKFPGAKVLSIEAQPMSVALAHKSRIFNGLDARWEIREGDFRDGKNFSETEYFDLITGTPPYFPIGTGILGDHPQKEACRFELKGGIEDYCALVSKHLSPAGVFAVIFPMQQASQIERVSESAKRHELVIFRERPIVLKEGEPPLLCLYLMMRASDLPEKMRSETWIETPLVIRTRTGDINLEYSCAKLSIGFPP
ncbi:MAG: methyltransferase [Bdellovibrionota bacterium]